MTTPPVPPAPAPGPWTTSEHPWASSAFAWGSKVEARPARPPWTARLWEADAESTASPVVLPAALVVGVVAALILRLENAGSALLVTGPASSPSGSWRVVADPGRGSSPSPRSPSL